MAAPALERDLILHRFLEIHGLTALDPRDLDLALTHRSYAYEKELGYDNERLEFLGDAFIGAITSEFLYERDTHADEGLLSKRRALLVSRSLLGRRAREMELGAMLLLGRGERETGGMQRLSTLGSALEALVGIVYMRLGFSAARDFVRRHVLESLTHLNAAELAQGDFKSTLQEWAQQRYKTVPAYTLLGEEGPDHDKQFLAQVAVAGRVLAQARGSRIKTAENEAARLALEKIEAGEVVSE